MLPAITGSKLLESQMIFCLKFILEERDQRLASRP